MAVDISPILSLIDNRRLSVASAGVGEVESFVVAMKEIVQSMADTLASRDKEIAQLKKEIKGIVCRQEHHNGCDCTNEKALYKCKNDYHCGFPHEFYAPNYCPQCGHPGYQVS